MTENAIAAALDMTDLKRAIDFVATKKSNPNSVAQARNSEATSQ